MGLKYSCVCKPGVYRCGWYTRLGKVAPACKTATPIIMYHTIGPFNFTMLINHDILCARQVRTPLDPRLTGGYCSRSTVRTLLGLA